MSRDLDFNFYFEADTVLVLDVLGASKALEDTTLDHNAHLGAERLGFFHQVRG